MYLTFYGAAREVTGSCYYLEAGGKKMLVDCGLKQGLDEEDGQKLPFNAADIDLVILTHAHIDHSGRLPLLVKEGFHGKIYAVRATCDLISILLRDSAKIQESDAKWENKKNIRAGKNEAVPLYTMEDTERTLKLLAPLKYNEPVKINESININFIDAGHILGSASVEIFLNEGNVSKKLVFSGDIGNIDQPIIKDPQCIKNADFLIMESTYGNKNHDSNKDYLQDFASLIDETLSRGGNVVIPSFAVGRTQSLIYFMREIKERKMVKGAPDFPVYVDSPLASSATRIYENVLSIYGDAQTVDILNKGLKPLNFNKLTFVDSAEDSKALNYDKTPKVIISSSGMCEAGRVKHHLKHNLWKKESAVIFAGFQAVGTLGRKILEGAKKVSIFGDEIAVKASVHNFTGLSAHADREGLLKWVSCFVKNPQKVFVTHGEEPSCEEFAKALVQLNFTVSAPYYMDKYDLSTGELFESAKESQEFLKISSTSGSKAYSSLVNANTKLQEIIERVNGANETELENFAVKISELAENLNNVKR